MNEANHQLQAFRTDIDILDQKLVELLNQRATISIKIGHVKKSHPTHVLDIKDSEREKHILFHIQQHNTGPLSNEQLTELFECIMSQSRDLQSNLS